MSESNPTEKGNAARKPYETPRLTKWGNLKTITAGGGGTRAEGHPIHSPQTKL